MASGPVAPAADLTPAQAKAIAVEAYVYTYPLVMMDMTRRLMTNVPPGVKPGLGPANVFHHFRTYPPADFREVVRPNFDTLYSSAWLDLTKEPMVVSVPDSGGRYYLVPLMDMWTDAYAVPGKRTSGTAAPLRHRPARLDREAAGRASSGSTRPRSTTGSSAAPRPTARRTTPPSTSSRTASSSRRSRSGESPRSRRPRSSPDPTVDMKTPPPSQVDGMTGDKYFAYAAELMKLHKPHATDWSIVARMKRLGIVPGPELRHRQGRPRWSARPCSTRRPPRRS